VNFVSNFPNFSYHGNIQIYQRPTYDTKNKKKSQKLIFHACAETTHASDRSHIWKLRYGPRCRYAPEVSWWSLHGFCSQG